MMDRKEWQKVIDECNRTISNAENAIEINEIILQEAEERIKEFPEEKENAK